ncbi:DUF4886 domain-containing protein [Terrimonas sp. NA20]|uniref:DUF4886 domain-containing protein n=1 Tax=Terrimonas ginsenosidimutans TaxID=2908004 RepID=A0ABS9KN90_9BACT|nr:DUF4886 domain-containing protein [Terrimonas ginsenosidimutans]MCG2613755.1 DUF4886 domain-containing protein [Terrimonas ginsenosidimutans]
MAGISSRLIIVLSFLILEGTASAQKKSKQQPLRLFLIGNSFSQNASKYLPEISKQGGHQLIIGRAEIGGCPLQRHWDSVAVNLADSSRGRAYNGRSLKQLLSEGTWDVVTIQQASVFSGDLATYSPYARNLYNFIRQVQPNAKIVFHQTWPYRADAKMFGRINGNVFAKDQKEMWIYSRSSYHSMADSLGIQLIPVGDAFWKVASDAKWGYKKDTTFDHKNPVYPHLPTQDHALNIGYFWDKDRKLAFDANHANDAGCYLAGLVWYGFLFKENPRKVSFVAPGIPEDFAVELRKVAAGVLKKNTK